MIKNRVDLGIYLHLKQSDMSIEKNTSRDGGGGGGMEQVIG
jgi:hypothetical protein